MADKLQEVAAIHITSYQQRMANLYHMHIKPCAFQAGDLVLRRVFKNTVDSMAKKFQPNWEGLYAIIRVGPTMSYTLNKLDRASAPKMWNVMHLKRYYQ